MSNNFRKEQSNYLKQMKLSTCFLVATMANPTSYHRSPITQHLMDQLVELVPDIDFGDVDANLTTWMELLMPVPEGELIDMMSEVDEFLNSILAMDLSTYQDAQGENDYPKIEAIGQKV